MVNQIRLNELMVILGQLCPDCMAKVRGCLATQMQQRTTDELLAEKIYPIILNVAEETGYPVEVILGSDTRHKLVEVRRNIAERARQRGFSLPVIGKALRRHHTTILHLLKEKNGHDA